MRTIKNVLYFLKKESITRKFLQNYERTHDITRLIKHYTQLKMNGKTTFNIFPKGIWKANLYFCDTSNNENVDYEILPEHGARFNGCFIGS